MISVIIPTYNRSHTLLKVLDSFFVQKHLLEIILVDDASTENLAEILRPFTVKYPNIPLRLIRNEKQSGAAYSRKRGLSAANGEYILFADDDLFLEENYTEVCLRKIQENKGSLVSGRLIYRLPNENIQHAIKRFGFGNPKIKPFDKWRFRINTEAHFVNDLMPPFYHAVYLCKKSVIKSIEIDPYYSRGNGFREETDPQMSLAAKGERALVTNETHVIHMHLSEVKSGGQRVNRLFRFYWTIFYTNYFLKKHYDVLKKTCALFWPQWFAMLVFIILELYVFFIRPFVILPQYIFYKILK